MGLKQKASMVIASVPVVMTRIATAASNLSTDVSIDRGRDNVMALKYADKMQWVLDSMYFLVDRAATLALLYLTLKIVLGGWDDIGAEIRGRKAFTLVIVALAGLKVGMMLIDVILAW